MKHRRMNQKLTRRLLSLTASLLTLWAVVTTAQSESIHSALVAVKETSLPKQLLRWELGDLFFRDELPLSTALALRQSPLLLAGRTVVSQAAPADSEESTGQTEPAEEPADNPAIPPSTLGDDLSFADNGVPSETVIPSSGSGYTVIDNVYIKSTSVKSIDLDYVSDGTFSAALSDQSPQVLIIHTHGSEAYTMPAGEEYESSGSFRTADARYSVIRVGDEIAATMSQYGISVLHDRALYDAPAYNGAYSRSMAAIQEYLAKYPSISFILDVHRDAIQDASGRQYKVLCQEDSHAAQVSLIMGSDYDSWQENLKLAIAVQHTIAQSTPTLMRPITLRNTGYNQQASVGSMLVEVGAAGNSLDEAIYAGRLFAQGFAQTVLGTDAPPA